MSFEKKAQAHIEAHADGLDAEQLALLQQERAELLNLMQDVLGEDEAAETAEGEPDLAKLKARWEEMKEKPKKRKRVNAAVAAYFKENSKQDMLGSELLSLPEFEENAMDFALGLAEFFHKFDLENSEDQAKLEAVEAKVDEMTFTLTSNLTDSEELRNAPGLKDMIANLKGDEAELNALGGQFYTLLLLIREVTGNSFGFALFDAVFDYEGKADSAEYYAAVALADELPLDTTEKWAEYAETDWEAELATLLRYQKDFASYGEVDTYVPATWEGVTDFASLVDDVAQAIEKVSFEVSLGYAAMETPEREAYVAERLAKPGYQKLEQVALAQQMEVDLSDTSKEPIDWEREYETLRRIAQDEAGTDAGVGAEELVVYYDLLRVMVNGGGTAELTAWKERYDGVVPSNIDFGGLMVHEVVEAGDEKKDGEQEKKAQSVGMQSDGGQKDVVGGKKKNIVTEKRKASDVKQVDKKSKYSDKLDLNRTLSISEPIKSQFIQKAFPSVMKILKDNSITIPPEVVIGQLMIESGYGSSKSKSYFGIKKWKGSQAEIRAFDSQEEGANGNMYSEKSNFEVYLSLEEGVMAYARFIKGNPRYKNAMAQSSSPLRYLQEIAKAGYATDSRYVQKCITAYNTALNEYKENGGDDSEWRSFS